MQAIPRNYSLVSYVTGSETENPMPPGKMDDELAEEFAEFFIQKIKTIRDGLEHHLLYRPVTQASQGLKHLNQYWKVM